jgi:hypothetical protein
VTRDGDFDDVFSCYEDSLHRSHSITRDQLNSNKVLLFGLRTRDGSTKTPDTDAGRPWRGITADATGIDFVGNEFRMPLRTSRNAGVGSRAELGKLPAPGAQGYMYISEPMRSHYGAISISGQLLKASATNEGAFERALTSELQGVTDDLKRKVNIDAYGDATGTLATITSGATSATQAVSTTINIQGGEYVVFYDSTLATHNAAAAKQITAYNRSGLTVTLSGSITTTTGDVMIRASSDDTAAVPNNDLNTVINGLANIIDSTGALHTLNPATAGQQFWSSTEIAASSAIVGDSLLRQLEDGVGFESGSDEELIFITTRGVRNRYANTLTSLKRFNDAESVKLRGGFTALMFDDNPMVYDDVCPLGTVFAVNTGAMFWSQMSDWEFMEEDTGRALHIAPGYDQYQAWLFKYCQLGTWARNRHGKITGAADDTR